jgi:hypothetical protein
MRVPTRTSAQFMEHFRGLPNNILTTAISRCTPGVDYSKMAKIDLADDYAGRDYGLGRIEMWQIDAKVVEMYLAYNQVSAAQSLKVFAWLRSKNLIEESQRRSRGQNQ